MKSGSICAALVAALTLATPLHAAEEPADPNRIDIVDAIECRLAAPAYMGFALALNGEEKIADKRHWVRIASKNPFMNEYDLPAPITVAGHYATRRVAFTSSGLLAILDLADPNGLAREQGIKNVVDASPLLEAMIASGKATPAEIASATQSSKFLGEKIVADRTESPTAGESYGAHTVIARNVSNATTHPGKTFYGCSYRVEVIGKDGQPL